MFRDFWHTTRYQTCTLLRFSILEAFLFERQEHVHVTSTLQLPRALFFHLSDWSADRLRALVEDDVNLWMDRHGLSIEALQDDGQGRFKLSMCMQFSHAMLVLSSHWSGCRRLPCWKLLSKFSLAHRVCARLVRENLGPSRTHDHDHDEVAPAEVVLVCQLRHRRPLYADHVRR